MARYRQPRGLKGREQLSLDLPIFLILASEKPNVPANDTFDTTVRAVFYLLEYSLKYIDLTT
jgi:hypothetical protein